MNPSEEEEEEAWAGRTRTRTSFPDAEAEAEVEAAREMSTSTCSSSQSVSLLLARTRESLCSLVSDGEEGARREGRAQRSAYSENVGEWVVLQGREDTIRTMSPKLAFALALAGVRRGVQGPAEDDRSDALDALSDSAGSDASALTWRVSWAASARWCCVWYWYLTRSSCSASSCSRWRAAWSCARRCSYSEWEIAEGAGEGEVDEEEEREVRWWGLPLRRAFSASSSATRLVES